MAPKTQAPKNKSGHGNGNRRNNTGLRDRDWHDDTHDDRSSAGRCSEHSGSQGAEPVDSIGSVFLLVVKSILLIVLFYLLVPGTKLNKYQRC